MKSSTEVLRELLDELGVEYEGGERSLRWRDRNGVMMQAFPLADGELGMDVWSCTPEQAIAATLGRGTCHVIATKKLGDSFGYWLSCGHSMVNPFDDHPDYCPWCGAKVADA